MAAAAGIQAAGSIISGVIGGIGGKDAAKQQAKSIKQALFEQQREYGITQSNLQPWVAGGQGALQAELDLLGIGGTSGQASGATTQDLVRYLASVGKGPSGKAMNRWLKQNPGATPEQQLAALKGLAGSNEVELLNQYALAHPYKAATAPVGASDAQAASYAALKASPAFQALYGTGQDTILQNAAATGGLRGGNTQNSLAQFGSSLLAQVIQNQLANLGGISGLGAQTGGTLGQIGQNNANAQSQLYGQLGNANATATAAPYAALQGIISQLTGGGQASLGNFFGGGGGSNAGVVGFGNNTINSMGSIPLNFG